ncbi:MAG: LytTR family transcriptional regulator [Clostridiales bacterium]|nr:LytTR family transcriptional regulator [Clostridiales bacterium]
MKFFLKISQDEEPSVTVVCNKITNTVSKIESICKENQDEILYGYDGDEIVPLNLCEVICFFTKDNKVCAYVGDKEYSTKLRIKQVLDMVDNSFIKINQGCVASVSNIEKFAVSFGGALKVVFKNGYSDYVSRRETSNIKRRFGL